jgi:hypothetical protein
MAASPTFTEKVAKVIATFPLYSEEQAARMIMSAEGGPPASTGSGKVPFTVPAFKWDAKCLWEEWENFISSIKKAFLMPGYEKFTQPQQIAIMSQWMGPRLDEITDSWDDTEAKTHRASLQSFQDEIAKRWEPMHNVIHCEMAFAECKREGTTTAMEFVQQLRRLAKKAKFTNSEDRV